MQIVLRRAFDLCWIFCAESDGAKSLIVHRWLKPQGLRYWMGTNEFQHSPAEAASDALDFMQEVRKTVNEINREKIHYQYGSNPCLLHLSLQANFGDERSNAHIFTQDTRWATLVMTVCIDGTNLPPMLIFKEKQDGRIVAKEFPTFPTGCTLLRECMDGQRCNAWVGWKNLKPFIASAPENVVPLLMLDSYWCHMMALAVGSIQNPGMEVENILGGYTSLCCLLMLEWIGH